jgi:hypothetical protein
MLRSVDDEELSQIRGGLLGWLKKAAKWVKNHVAAGANWIAYKGRF